MSPNWYPASCDIQREGAQLGWVGRKGCITFVLLLWFLPQHLHLAIQMPEKKDNYQTNTTKEVLDSATILIRECLQVTAGLWGWRENLQTPYPPAQSSLVWKRHLQLHSHLDKDTKLLGIQWSSANSTAISLPSASKDASFKVLLYSRCLLASLQSDPRIIWLQEIQFWEGWLLFVVVV